MGEIIQEDICKLQKDNMLEYMISIMKDRAIANTFDGFKPVHRLTVWAMYDDNILPSKPHVKCARTVGNVIGKYHPHGDQAAYGALVRLNQDFSLNIPICDPHGNVGSYDGSSAAAMRYTESRLSKFAVDMLEGINKNAVDFEPNFDNTEKQPKFIPMKVCNLLINGSIGIAGGFMQSILPHNLNEVCDVTIKLLKDPEYSLKKIASSLYPDFPTGGILCSKKAVEKAYLTGSGSVKNRCKTHIETKKNGRSIIHVTEIPYMITTGPKDSNPKSGLIHSIVSSVKDGKIDGISDVKDLGSQGQIDIAIYLKKDEDPEVVLNQLFKYTIMETTQTISLVSQNDKRFKVYNIKDIFTEVIEFRKKCIRRTILFDINDKKRRVYIIEGLIIALEDIDNVVAIIKKSKNPADAKAKLIKKYELSDLQATEIINMRLAKLTSLEIEKLQEEYDNLLVEIEEMTNSLSEEAIVKRMIEEQKEMKKKYGRERRTEVCEIDTNITIEDIIPDEKTTIIISQGNYIKRVPSDSFKTQKRTAKGFNTSNNITEIFSASTKDHLLCFTNTGRVYDLKAFEIKEATLKAKGYKVESYLSLKAEESVTNILCIDDNKMNDSESYFVFLTKHGQIKKTKLELFANIRSTGIIATMLRKDDELVSVKYIDMSKDMQDIILSTKNGQTVRYEQSEIKETTRDTYGVMAICLQDDDVVTDMCLIESEKQLIFFSTKHGLGKTVKVTDMVEKIDPNTKEKRIINDGFPRLKRSSNIKGRIGIKLKENDELVSLVAINSEEQNLMVVTNKKLKVVPSGEFRKPVKRPTFGMKLISLDEDDFVTKVVIS
jgi:DNA gyrase subunit A